jgi:hypothetical protein
MGWSGVWGGGVEEVGEDVYQIRGFNFFPMSNGNGGDIMVWRCAIYIVNMINVIMREGRVDGR